MMSSGFVTTMTVAFGAWRAICSLTPATIFALVLSRSSRVIPGFRGRPAVTTTTSEPAISARSFVPVTFTSQLRSGEQWSASVAFA
jgi:hypothetical protein